LIDPFTFTLQTEIQLIVGSRYHELIESADSVVRDAATTNPTIDRKSQPIDLIHPQVSMYRSCKRLGLVLQELPPRFETVRGLTISID
jgi:hypothetical protein